MDLDNPFADLDLGLNVDDIPPVAKLDSPEEAEILDALGSLESGIDNANAFMKNAKFVLTGDHKDLLDFIEQYWYMNQAYPSPAAIGAWARSINISVSLARELEDDILPYLTARGIKSRAHDTRLNSEQLAAANTVLNFTDKRTINSKLRSLGITPTQWDGWLRQKAFAEYLANRTNETLDNNLHEAHLGLLKAVERGDPSALKLYYTLTGKMQQEASIVNVNLILQQALDVIVKEIQDPDTLARISSGIDVIVSRGQAAAIRSAPVAERISEIEGDYEIKENSTHSEITKEPLANKRHRSITESDNLFNL